MLVDKANFKSPRNVVKQSSNVSSSSYCMVEQRLFVGRDKLLYWEFQKYEVMAMSVVGGQQKKKITHISQLKTFAPKSSYGEIFFISRLELVDKVLTPKMKKKMGVTDFVSEKMAVEKCLNFDKSVIITRCSLLC